MTPSEVRGRVVDRIAGDALVMSLCKTRVYADAAPEDCAFPHVTVSRTSHVRGLSNTGYTSDGDTGLQVTAWALDPTSRDNVAEAVRRVLYSMASGDAGIEHLTVTGDADSFAWQDDGGGGGLWICRFDAVAAHQCEVAA